MMTMIRNAVLLFVLVTTGFAMRSDAQTFDNKFARKFVLGDNSSPIVSLTLKTPTTLTSAYSLTFPSAVGALGQILVTTDAIGTLGWTNPGTLLGSSYWSLSGNAGTTPGVAANQNYFGTSDAQNLILATSATERMRILSTGNIGVNSTTAPQLLTLGGDIGIVTSGSKITASGTAKELIMEETNDVYGTSRLRLQDRNGSNGALFEQSPSSAGIDLVDFGFIPGAKVQSNIRLEARTADLRGGQNVSSGTGEEFQFLFASTQATPQYVLSIGQSATLLESGKFGIGYSASYGTFPAASPLELLDVHTGNIILSNTGTASVTGTAGILKLQGTKDGVSSFQAGAQASNTFNYTLPTAVPTAGQLLSINTISGATPYTVVLSWATPLTIPITNTSNTTTTLLSLTNSSTTTGQSGNFVISSSTNTSTALTASTAGTSGTAISGTASGNGGSGGHIYGVLGIATDATQGANTNAGTGVRAEGNGTTTDANQNCGLQIVNGGFIVGRQASNTANDNTAGNNILTEDDANGLTDQGPSGVVDLAALAAPAAQGLVSGTLTVKNRYVKSTSIILLTILNSDATKINYGAGGEAISCVAESRGTGTFLIRVTRASVLNAGTAAWTPRIGFLIINAGK